MFSHQKKISYNQGVLSKSAKVLQKLIPVREKFWEDGVCNALSAQYLAASFDKKLDVFYDQVRKPHDFIDQHSRMLLKGHPCLESKEFKEVANILETIDRIDKKITYQEVGAHWYHSTLFISQGEASLFDHLNKVMKPLSQFEDYYFQISIGNIHALALVRQVRPDGVYFYLFDSNDPMRTTLTLSLQEIAKKIFRKTSLFRGKSEIDLLRIDQLLFGTQEEIELFKAILKHLASDPGLMTASPSCRNNITNLIDEYLRGLSSKSVVEDNLIKLLNEVPALKKHLYIISNQKVHLPKTWDFIINIPAKLRTQLIYTTPTIPVETKTSLLHLACMTGEQIVVQKLLEDACDLNVLAEKMTPLHVAIIKGHSGIVRLLYEKGANKDHSIEHTARDISGSIIAVNIAPLHLSVMHQHPTIFRLMSDEWKISPSSEGAFSMHWAIRTGNIELVQMLVNEYKINPKSGLRDAIKEGNLEMVQLLISLIPVNELSNIFLEDAIGAGHLNIVRLLHEKYKLVLSTNSGDVSDFFAHTLLNDKVTLNPEVIHYMLDSLAFKFTWDAHRWMLAEKLATLRGQINLVKIILDDAKMMEDCLNTLFAAVSNGDGDVIHYLLEKGLDPTAKYTNYSVTNQVYKNETTASSLALLNGKVGTLLQIQIFIDKKKCSSESKSESSYTLLSCPGLFTALNDQDWGKLMAHLEEMPLIPPEEISLLKRYQNVIGDFLIKTMELEFIKNPERAMERSLKIINTQCALGQLLSHSKKTHSRFFTSQHEEHLVKLQLMCQLRLISSQETLKSRNSESIS